jgi:hypothetical protein
MEDSRIEKIKRFVQDPDWNIIENILWERIEPLRYIEDIDDKQTGTDIKAQVKANKKVFNALYGFLKEVGMLKKDYKSKNISYK